MKRNSIVLLAGALILATGVALLARAILAPPPAPSAVQETAEAPPPSPSPPPRAAVVTAARAVEPGEFLDGTHLRWQEVDDTPDKTIYFLRGVDALSSLYGATVRQAVKAGQALTAAAVVHPGEPGFLAAVLTPGRRAVSVPTGRVETSFGLVSPGDRVDVVLSLRRQDNLPADPSAPPVLAAQTILSNVRVLALNNQVREEPQLRRENDEDGKDNRRTTDASRRSFETATLEVAPAQAEQLAVAKEVGTLQLSLRSSREPVESGTSDVSQRVTTLGMTTSVYPSGQTEPATVQAFRGPTIETINLSR